MQASLPGGMREYDLVFEQSYQEIRGGTRVAGGYLPAFEARLEGDRIEFVLVDGGTSHRFEGRVRSGLEIEGDVRSGAGRALAKGRWRATRVTGVRDEG